MCDAVSCCRCVFIFVVSLGPDVVLAAWHLGLFKFVGLCLSLLQWEAQFFLMFLLQVFAWILLQWLQHLCLVSWISLVVLVTIFENGRCLLFIVFKWGAVIVKWSWKVFGPAKAVSQWVIHSGLEKAVILWQLNGGLTVYCDYLM